MHIDKSTEYLKGTATLMITMFDMKAGLEIS